MNNQLYLYHVKPLGYCPTGYEESLKACTSKQGSRKILILFFKDDLGGMCILYILLNWKRGGGAIFRLFSNSKETKC